MLKSDAKKSSKLNLKVWVLIVLTNVLICIIFSTILSMQINRRLDRLEFPSMTQTQNVNINTLDDKEKVDINNASMEELKSLPHIGDVLAKEIIANRPYESIHDLKGVKGIGESIFNSISKDVMIK